MSSILAAEIHSQPAMIAQLFDNELTHIQQIVTALPTYEYVLIAARGSSDHAALYAKYAWGALAGYPVALAAPSLYTLYDAPPRMTGALVVGISQSGQSPDIVAVLTEARRQGRPTLAITNDVASPLAATADHVVALHVGAERSIAATKTYTAQLAVMAAFAAALSGDPHHLAALQTLPDALAANLQAQPDFTRFAMRYHQMQQCVVLGRGYNYATAAELALKLKELTYVTATAYSAADFKHGPIATIDATSTAILVMPSGAAFADMRDLAHELHQRGADLLVIADAEPALALAQTPLPLHAAIPEWLSPIAAIMPGQLLALHLALAKGIDPDVPRGLNKVTLTL